MKGSAIAEATSGIQMSIPGIARYRVLAGVSLVGEVLLKIRVNQ